MNKNVSKNKRSGLMLIVGIMLLLTLAIAFSIGGILARYVQSENIGDSATVATAGVDKLQLCEHETKLNAHSDILKEGKLYYLDTNSKKAAGDNYSYAYTKALPGVSIPKDTFVELKIKSEVSYELYLEVEDTIPYIVLDGKKTEDKAVTVTIDPARWTPTGKANEYKYVNVFRAGTEYNWFYDTSIKDDSKQNVIWILKDNELKVSEYYKGERFTVKFKIQLKQVY